MLRQSLLAHYNVEEHWKVSGGRGHLLHLLHVAIDVPAGVLQDVQRWNTPTGT